MPTNQANLLKEISIEFFKKIYQWLKGKLVLAVLITILSYVGLRVIGVEYALWLALLSGFMDLIPIAGPIVSLVMAASSSFITEGVGRSILVVILYIIIQQVEAFYLEPKIVGKSIGIHPVVIFISVIIASSVLGVAGAVLVIPALILVTVIYSRLKNNNKNIDDL